MNRLVTSIRPALGRSISSATLGARPAARRAPQVALVPSRGLNDTAYQTFFKSNVRYVTFIVAGAVALEVVYGSATDMLWESMNRGKLFHHVDWTKFKTDDDDDDDDDEDDE
eukprot:g593.t1